MKQPTHTLVIKSKKNRSVLKRFEYPSRLIPNKFYWEKIKEEELTKLLKSRDLSVNDVIMAEEIT